MFTVVDWHALLTCPSQQKIKFYHKDSAALNVRNQIRITVLLKSEEEKCLQDLSIIFILTSVRIVFKP